MLYAKIITPPKRIGAKVVSVDDSKAKEIKGYITTIPFNFPDEALNGGVLTHVPLIIASNYPSAMRAANLIEVNWNTEDCSIASSSKFEEEAFQLLKDKNNGRLSWKKGEFDTCGDGKECKKLERSYKTSMVAHVALEPMSYAFDDGFLHIYAGHKLALFFQILLGNLLACLLTKSYTILTW